MLRGGAGFRGIEPVTSGSLIAVDGSKNDELLLIELVVLGIGCRRGRHGAFRRRHRPARRGRRSAALRLGGGRALGLVLGRHAPGAGGLSGNRNSIAVCATPTTMIATLAAISSVFSSFKIFLPRDSGASAPSSIAHRRRHRRRRIGCRHRRGHRRQRWRGGSRRVELRLGRKILGGLLERPFEPFARLAAERLRHLHGRVEIGRLRGIARGGDGGRLAAGFRGHRPGVAERGLGGGDAGRGRSGLDARRAAAGLERRIGRQIGVDRLALRAARHLPRAGGVRGSLRWRGIGASAAGGARMLRRAAAAWAPAACIAGGGLVRRQFRDQVERRLRQRRLPASARRCGRFGRGRGGAAGAGAGSAGGARRPRGPPLRISSR